MGHCDELGIKGAEDVVCYPSNEAFSLCTDQGVQEHRGQTCEVTTGKRNDKNETIASLIKIH